MLIMIKNKGFFVLSAVVLAVIMFSSLSYSFTKGINVAEIDEVYAPGALIRGWVNISINESSDSVLRNNRDESTSLIEFLNNTRATYKCIPRTCSATYEGTETGMETKTFLLKTGEEKTIGLRVSGYVKDNAVTNITFKVKSNAAASCNTPLIIDILAQNDEDLYYLFDSPSSDYSCGYSTGGFESNQTIDYKEITNQRYCENITLPKSPGFQIGAVIKKIGENAKLTMSMYKADSAWEKLAGCDLPLPSTIDFESVSCVVNYSTQKREDYYVCINADKQTQYQIRSETNNPKGFYGDIGDEFVADYEIFARAAKYAGFSDFVFEKKKFEKKTGSTITSYVDNYIEANYDGDCVKGCIIPIRFISGTDQEMVISDALIRYDTTAGQSSSNLIFNVKNSSARISMDFTKLDISNANFHAPRPYGTSMLTIFLNNQEIISETIKVERLPIVQMIYPTQAAVGIGTMIYVEAYSPDNATIKKYYWDFGDGETTETTENETYHRFMTPGYFTVKVTVEDKNKKKGTGEAKIRVGSYEEAISDVLDKLRNYTQDVNKEIMNKWYNSAVEDYLKLNETEEKLNELERGYETAHSDEEYKTIADELFAIKMPYSVRESHTGKAPFMIDYRDIDLDYLKEAGAGDFDENKEQQYREEVGAWFVDNIQGSIDYKTISAYYEDNTIEEILGVFSYNIKPKTDDKLYLIIHKATPSVLVFRQDYGQKQISGGRITSLEFSGEKTIELVLKEDIEVDDLVLYVSPSLSSFEIGEILPCNHNNKCEAELNEDYKNCRDDCYPWKRLLFWIVIILIAASIVYTVLQEWYRRRYESHLFKTRNDIYNIINYMNTALKAGLSKNEIVKRLKAVGWDSEQISYAFKKREGKRTGMHGFNIFEWLERKRRIKKVEVERYAVRGEGNKEY